ncbi:ankyrin repeat and fibronectin type-III domain-containing protein 1 isoform X3 [Nematostella vectensis]|nr:ankyrin repeat and fibronectin type-III domain-containing protein 1 isoform X3 [Nematostella vectensis]
MVTNDEDLPPPRSRRLMYKAPLRLKFALSSKNAAWRLEDDDTDDSKHQSHGSSCTDETPFSYTASGLYFTSEQSRRDSRRLIKNGLHTEGELSSKRSSSSEGSDLSINSKTRGSGLVRLARKLSQRRERRSPITEKINVRSQSLENLSSPTSSTQSIDRAVSGKSPRLYRTLSMGQKPVPRQRLASVENRFSGTNKDQAKEKLKRRKENVLDALIDAIVCQDVEEVKSILETEAVNVNGQNAEGFVPLEFAVMLGFHHIAKMLQAFGAKESSRVPFLDKHLRMLSNEAEQRLQDLTLAVVHVTNCTASEIKDNERQLREWEWRRLILKRMMNGLNNADPPGKPGSVTVSVGSEDSLLVRFTENLNEVDVIITKYKIEWSRNEMFDPIEGEYVLDDLRSLEYTIPSLQKSVMYYVRGCCGNLKGFGPWLESTPPCVMPSSWHEVDDSKPRFQGRLVVIDDLFSRVWKSHDQFTPQPSHDSNRPRSAVTSGEIDGEFETSPKSSRRQAMKKSIYKYTNIFFHSAPKFARNMKRGVYLATLLYSSEDRVMVTHEENIPAVEVDDNYPTTFLQDFCWLMKVACTWKDVKKLKQEVEKNSASTSVLFRCKLLCAVDALQSALGRQNLGQLHYKPVKDRNGSTVIVVVNYLHHSSLFRPRIMSLKWTSLSKLQKKLSYQPGDPLDLCYASDMLITTVKEKVDYFQKSRKPLERGMYIGYLKLRTFVDAIHVVVQESNPNVLPHVKIRDNPNVSREEWQWIQSLDSLGQRKYEPSKSAQELQLLVAQAAEKLMDQVGVSRDAAKLHRIYDREVVELDENVSFLIVFPPPEDVCSAPGQVDTLTSKKDYISLPVQTFEMIHMCTYQKDFICHYSRLSSVLDMDSVLAQQALREAFSSGEVEKAKQRQIKLMEFQLELDETWKGMRWILDALHYARDRQVRGGIPLVEVFKFSHNNGDVIKNNECYTLEEPGEGHQLNHAKDSVIRVYSTGETGLPAGAQVTLSITPATTANEIVRTVIRRLEKTCDERGKSYKNVSDESIKDFCLVAVFGSQEKCFPDSYKVLQFQNPWKRGKLFVRLRSSAMAATAFGQVTSV